MRNRTRIALIILAGVVVVAGLAYYAQNRSEQENTQVPAQAQQDNNEEAGVTVVAQDLHVPWEIAFLPNGDMLVTERNGVLSVIVTNGESKKINVPGVVETGEGGLMGLAVHPDYSSNNFLYLYFTARSGSNVINRVVRYTFNGSSLVQNKIIIDNIPGGTIHNGGRIAFGPDNLLYITTGDAGNGELAQNTRSLAGKILRVTDDGSIPTDNHFGNAVYSYGHRNPQGLAWDRSGNLWATEHGRSGIASGYDEINLIEEGANYGWPVIEGSETRTGMKSPVLQSGATTTWAPADLVFLNNKLYFTGLRGQTFYEVPIISEGKLGQITEHFKNEYGRLRALALRNNNLYFSTSNQDGRGNPRTGDDKILKVTP